MTWVRTKLWLQIDGQYITTVLVLLLFWHDDNEDDAGRLQFVQKQHHLVDLNRMTASKSFTVRDGGDVTTTWS